MLFSSKLNFRNIHQKFDYFCIDYFDLEHYFDVEHFNLDHFNLDQDHFDHRSFFDLESISHSPKSLKLVVVLQLLFSYVFNTPKEAFYNDRP